ncbi:hypothetical protein HSBAA_02320 [Vreelandella sulfidaeris]|uniref:Uncharacterized protein n=1 Tax=Vreelandella sulfidaeris TaxID=115553 RepID=A0A455TZJ2_9GAMM|nr:hypothetical protein HSBAA_02320 [Halomonas sulfidaeris]
MDHRDHAQPLASGARRLRHQAVADLRKVAWDKGLVRCGMNRWNKPMFHDSEVAAIAWSIQQILYRRGFFGSGWQSSAG